MSIRNRFRRWHVKLLANCVSTPRDDLQKYMVVFGIGVRIWFQRRFWHWGIHDVNDDEKLTIELGPISIYYTRGS